MPADTELIQFFEKIYGEQSGVVRMATRNKDKVWKNALFPWPSEQAAMLSYIHERVASAHEVHYSPDLYQERAMHLGKGEKLTKDLVKTTQVICLDFDGNAPATDEWYAENDLPLPSIRIQSSTADRQHAYWILDEPVTEISAIEAMRKTVTYRAKADVSGWDAGQLLRPPYTVNFGYIHPERKQSYAVKIEEVSDRVYGVDKFPVPKDFRPLVGASIDAANIPSWVTVLADNDFVHGFTDCFSQSIGDIPTGARSDQLSRVGHYAAESGLSDSEIYSLVKNADDRWGKYVHRTDRHKRLVDIVEYVRAAHPIGVVEPKFVDEETEIVPKSLFTFGGFLASNIVIDWHYEGLMSTGGIGILAGPPGIGKTQIGVRFASCTALGRDFLKWENTRRRPARVMFFSMEMDHASLKYFVNQMSDLRSHEGILSENLFFVPTGQAIYLDRKEGRAFLEMQIQVAKPDVIFLDSLSKTSSKTLSADENVIALNEYFVSLRKRFGCSTVLIHHSKKMQGKGVIYEGEQDDLYGNRFIGAEADFILSLVPNGESIDEIKVVESKVRLGRRAAPFAIRRTDKLDFVLTDGTTDETLPGMVIDFYGAFEGDSHRGTSSPDTETGSVG